MNMSSAPQSPLPIDYRQPGTPADGRSPRRKLIGWFVFVVLAIAMFVLLRSPTPPGGAPQVLSLDQFYDALQGGEVKSVAIEGDALGGMATLPTKAGGQVVAPFRTDLPQGMSQSWGFVQWLLQNRNGATIHVENNTSIVLQFVLPLVPWLLIFLFIWFFVFRQLRRNKREPLPVVVVNPVQP